VELEFLLNRLSSFPHQSSSALVPPFPFAETESLNLENNAMLELTSQKQIAAPALAPAFPSSPFAPPAKLENARPSLVASSEKESKNVLPERIRQSEPNAEDSSPRRSAMLLALASHKSFSSSSFFFSLLLYHFSLFFVL